MDAERTSARVAAIVAAAEEAAQRMRAEAEERMRARIAEADRAAEARVRAAEAEGRRKRAEQEAKRIVAAAESDATEQRERTRRHAQELLQGAHEAARSVQVEGKELGDNLQALAGSLRTNAERLLGDVARAHQALSDQLDRVEADRGLDRRRRPARAGDDSDLDVPEFIPGG